MTENLGDNNGQFVFCDQRGSEHAKGVRLDLSGRPRVYDASSGNFALSCG